MDEQFLGTYFARQIEAVRNLLILSLGEPVDEAHRAMFEQVAELDMDDGKVIYEDGQVTLEGVQPSYEAYALLLAQSVNYATRLLGLDAVSAELARVERVMG